ncbi:MAG: archaellin/type IV pilin N-terminal domain-containing protein [Nanoarchaeota archaeon]
MRKKTKKGISPLVAAIMLIAFTMVIAGILAGWATRFTQTQQREMQYCIDAKAFIQGGSYTSINATHGTLKLVVYNNGKVPLEFIVLLTYADETKHPDSLIERYKDTFTTEGGEIKTFTISPIWDDLQEATIQSQRCMGAQDLLQKEYIVGI